MIIEAAIMASEGKNAREIVEYIESLKPFIRSSFVVDTLTYQFRAREEDNEYEIRKLNRKTKNPTVIFRVRVKTRQEISDLELFKEELL